MFSWLEMETQQNISTNPLDKVKLPENFYSYYTV